MTLKIRNSRRTRRWAATAGVIGLAAVLYAATAPTNDLGSEKPYGIAASTYTNTVAGTSVTGGVCFTTGPAVAPTVSGAYGACPAAAGTDQTAALADLNNAAQGCTAIGAGPLEGISVSGGAAGTFPPGCYERAGAMDITANGIVTLNGNGVYIFKSTGGALTTGANSRIVLSGAACANNVFWAPVGATTLGASSTFIGNILDAAGITMGLAANLTGRALAFGGTVTTNTNTITVPADCAVTTHLIVNKTVVNNSGGVLTAASFSGTIAGAVVATGGNTWSGASTDRVLTTVGAYNVTETAQAGYTATFSAGCSGTIAAGETRTCTVTNTDTPSVPTLPQWFAILLSLGLIGAGYLQLRHRARTPVRPGR